MRRLIAEMPGGTHRRTNGDEALSVSHGGATVVVLSRPLGPPMRAQHADEKKGGNRFPPFSLLLACHAYGMMLRVKRCTNEAA